MGMGAVLSDDMKVILAQKMTQGQELPEGISEEDAEDIKQLAKILYAANEAMKVQWYKSLAIDNWKLANNQLKLLNNRQPLIDSSIRELTGKLEAARSMEAKFEAWQAGLYSAVDKMMDAFYESIRKVLDKGDNNRLTRIKHQSALYDISMYKGNAKVMISDANLALDKIDKLISNASCETSANLLRKYSDKYIEASRLLRKEGVVMQQSKEEGAIYVMRLMGRQMKNTNKMMKAEIKAAKADHMRKVLAPFYCMSAIGEFLTDLGNQLAI